MERAARGFRKRTPGGEARGRCQRSRDKAAGAPAQRASQEAEPETDPRAGPLGEGGAAPGLLWEREVALEGQPEPGGRVGTPVRGLALPPLETRGWGGVGAEGVSARG